VNTIQAVMLIGLGFIVANLAVLALIPAYRRRCERLAEERVRRHLPATEAEIRADRDRLRAEFAVKAHQLISRLESARLAAARQTIEINLRDAKVGELEARAAGLATRLEEMSNARTVLEATIHERLPRVEQRLAEARKLIFQRDREIAALTADAGKQARALEEAQHLNAELKADIARRQAAAERAEGADVGQAMSDPRFNAEVALRSEIESLRAKSREQAALVARLQAQLVQGGESANAVRADTGGEAAAAGAVAGAEDSARVAVELAAAEATVKALREAASAGELVANGLDQQVRSLKSRVEDQASEIARLKAALAVFDAGESEEGGASIRESRVALKARASALQAQLDSQNETLQKLRSELAGVNERMARQAAQHVEEMRRIGGAEGRRATSSREARRAAAAEAASNGSAGGSTPASTAPERAKVGGFLKALGVEPPAGGTAEAGEAAKPASSEHAKMSGEGEPRRQRLSDRLASLAKS
jgi:chromosome segregation ATPase